MTAIASHVSAFLRERLPVQRAASVHTCDTYAYAFQLLFEFASQRLGLLPSQLTLENLDAAMVLAFLDHLEKERGNHPRTRNARLAAIKSFFRFVEYRVPSILEQSRQVLAIPTKRADARLVPHLTSEEVHALLDVPDVSTRMGIRDRAMMHVAYAAGLRVSELVNLRRNDVSTHPHASLRILGKGRKERSLPLWRQAAKDLKAWLAVRGEIGGVDEVFVGRTGTPLTRSGFAYILDKHARIAATRCAGMRGRRVTPHVLRHTCALTVLEATHDIRKVSLWLGHADLQTTQVYLRADPKENLRTMEAILPPELRQGSFRPPDRLLALLRGS